MEMINLTHHIPPWEKIIQVDLIRDCILNQMEFSDFLTFRHLSHNVRLLSLSSFRRRSQIRFRDKICSQTNKHLNNFTLFWRKSKSELFPCTSFAFEFSLNLLPKRELKILNGKSINRALSKFGYHVDHLSLKWIFPMTRYTKRRGEFTALEELASIVCKTPNLRYLYFDYPARCRWEDSSRTTRSALRLTDPEFIKLQSKWETGERPSLEKLAKLELGRFPLAKILEGIIQWAPNLKQVNIESFCEHFLASPINRLHLLKNLVINPPKTNFEILENVPFFILEPGRNGKRILQLRRILLDLSVFKNQGGGIDTIVQLKIANIFNKVLDSSWNTFNEIKWDGVTTLRGILWPAVMPKLRSLIMLNPFDLAEYSLFPIGFNWSERFPILGSILVTGFNDQDISSHFAGFKYPVIHSEQTVKKKTRDFHDVIFMDDYDSVADLEFESIETACRIFKWCLLCSLGGCFIACFFAVITIELLKNVTLQTAGHKG